MWYKIPLIIILFLSSTLTAQTRRAPVKSTVARSLNVLTEPKAKVWMDDILRGTTDESGKLTIKPVPAGAHKIRIRASGFKEVVVPVIPAKSGDLKITLVKTTDEAEIAFQQAEIELTRDRDRAVENYKKAITARPRYPEAQLALARVLYDKGDYDEALKAVAEARKLRPVYPEVSAVEGRIYKAYNEEDKAVASYKRSISEGKGFQPEAHTGLAFVYQERAQGLMSSGDLQSADENFMMAANELKTALKQLSGAPDSKDLYQILGDLYYRAKKYQEAINAYEEFLKIFPDSNEAVSVRSLIVQTRKEMNGEQ